MGKEAKQANKHKGETVTAHSHPGEEGQGWDLTQVPWPSMLMDLPSAPPTPPPGVLSLQELRALELSCTIVG